MKRTGILLLALLLAVLAGCAPAAAPSPGTAAPAASAPTAETAPSPGTATPGPTTEAAPPAAGSPEGPGAPAEELSVSLPAAGVSFRFPPEMEELRGVLQPGYGYELEDGSGVYLSGLTYCAMTQEKYDELVEKGTALTQEDMDFVGPRLVDFLLVYTIDGGRGEDALKEVLSAYGLPGEDCRKLGSTGEYSFFCVINPLAGILDQVSFDEGFREEYDDLIRLCEEDLSWIILSAPQGLQYTGDGSALAFETTDLDGNPVSADELFRGYRLTMVNLWGTYCGPCISEMPELEELNRRLEEKGCAILGVVVDVSGPGDSAGIDAAREILADTGVTYRNLLPWGTLDTDLPARFIPSTYFVDSEGQVIDGPVVGARGGDEYEALIDALLASLEP